MTEDPKQILTESISTQELERRWSEVRGRMKEEAFECSVGTLREKER
jgi:hypothetical protein